MIRVDYTGKKFGELTVIGIAEDEPGKPKKWKCLCSCGNTTIVQANNLKTGQTRSCGCLKVKPTSLDGKKFGRLTVIRRCENDTDGTTRQLCLCDCGKYIKVRSRSLLSGNTKSCGCLLSDSTRGRAIKQRWNNECIDGNLPFKNKIGKIRSVMIQRCINPNNKSYKYYGARGISVCEEWLNEDDGAKNFYEWAMNNGYAEGLSIDRIKVDGDYEPSNCRWVDNITQMNNMRSNRLLTYNGETHTMAEWGRIIGIPYSVLRSRISCYHWSIERALTEKPKKCKKRKGG